jgi:iron complex transport system ATP-binding protein
MGVMLLVSRLGYCLPNGRRILDDIGFELQAGQLLCILGPNGVGKSTLLRCLNGLNPLSAGSVEIDGRDLGKLSRRELGCLIGLVPQSDAPVFAFTVREAVEMGRAPHLGWMSAPGEADRALVADILERMGIAALAERLYPELSGGERQMVLIARALAQQPRLLILDEPTSHLDFANAMRVLELARGLADAGMAVIMTSHAPDHAFLAADVTLAMRPGSATFGPTASLLTEERLSLIYGRPVRTVRHEGRMLCFTPTSLPGL